MTTTKPTAKQDGPGRPALSPGTTAARIVVTLSPGQLEAFEDHCWQRRLTRSAAFREMLEMWLGNK